MTKTILRYYFKISYKDLSGQLWKLSCTVDVLDAAGADREAYRRALITFADFIILNRDFEAPETLTIEMHKEMKYYDLQGD